MEKEDYLSSFLVGVRNLDPVLGKVLTRQVDMLGEEGFVDFVKKAGGYTQLTLGCVAHMLPEKAKVGKSKEVRRVLDPAKKAFNDFAWEFSEKMGSSALLGEQVERAPEFMYPPQFGHLAPEVVHPFFGRRPAQAVIRGIWPNMRRMAPMPLLEDIPEGLGRSRKI